MPYPFHLLGSSFLAGKNWGTVGGRLDSLWTRYGTTGSEIPFTKTAERGVISKSGPASS